VPRIRTVKPELPSDAKLASVSRDARLTFVLLITQADDEGLVAAAPRQLLGALYPHDDDVTGPMLRGWVDELAAIGVVRWRKTVDGTPVLELTNWSKHQRVDNKSKSHLAATLEPDPESAANTNQQEESPPQLAESCGGSRRPAAVRGLDLGPRTLDLGPAQAGGQNGAHGSKPPQRRPSRTSRTDYTPEFEAAWELYPKREGNNPKIAAFTAWRSRLFEGDEPPAMTEGVRRYAAFVRAKGKEGTEWVMQAQTFFGPDKQFNDAWAVNADPPKTNGPPRKLAATEMLLEPAK
jgi:hypothetical protein